MAQGRRGGDGGENRSVRQMRHMEAEVHDVLIGKHAPEAGASALIRSDIAAEAGECDAMPDDAIGASLKDDMTAPRSGKVQNN